MDSMDLISSGKGLFLCNRAEMARLKAFTHPSAYFSSKIVTHEWTWMNEYIHDKEKV